MIKSIDYYISKRISKTLPYFHTMILAEILKLVKILRTGIFQELSFIKVENTLMFMICGVYVFIMCVFSEGI